MKKDIAKVLYKPILMFVSVQVMLLSCTKTDRKQAAFSNNKVSHAPMHVTIVANLPASARPQEIFLSETPSPLKVTIPVKEGNHYIVENAVESEIIQLFPPVKHLFIDPLNNLPIAPEAQGTAFFTTYDTEDGLALDAILCSMEDKNGNLWFGTAGGGISKYNGKYFLNYTTVQGLAFNTVNVIYEDKAGNIWFGTSGGGVSKFDGNSFVNYSTGQGLANNSVSSILEDEKGNFWFGTADGLSKFDGKSFITLTTANNSVWSITEDKTGNLWVGTTGGVCKYNGKTFVNYTTAQGLTSNAVVCMIQDKSGNFWFGTRDGGVSKFDGKSFVNFTTSQGLAGNKVVNIMEDRSGNLWFATYGHGVSKYDGKTFVNFNTIQGLAGNVVAGITEDKTGSIWFGTYGAGISKYNGKSFVNFTTARGLANNVVRSIAEDKSGNLWFGTNGGGICEYDGNSFTNFTTAQGLANNLCYCITEDKADNIWFGTLGGGLSKYDGKSFTNYTKTQGLASNDIISLFEDNQGNLWIGTNGGGVSRFNGKSFVNFTTAQGLADNTVQCIAEDKSGNLWFGTNAGVSQYDGKTFVNYNTEQGLANNIINSITIDRSGNLWIGTEEGLSLIRSNILNGSNSGGIGKEISVGQIFQNFTTNDGLPDNYVTQVVQENQNKLYVGTNLGICELIAENLSDNQKEWKVGKTFNSHTGYPVKDVNAGQNTMFKDSRGIIWIGTGSDKTGLVRFNPSEIHENRRPPLLEIHNIKINNEPVSWYNLLSSQKRNANVSGAESITAQSCKMEEIATFGKVLNEAGKISMIQKFKDIRFDGIDKWYPIPQNLVLPYKNNDISFDFTAIDPGEGPLIKYQYQLEGSDKEWSSLSNKSSASFGNLFEGTYTFRLRAQNIDGIWGKQLNYTFTVSPPWWRTWWAYFIYSLLFTVIVFIVHRYQKQRVIRIERGKAQIKELAQAKEIEKAYTELKSTQAQLIQSEKMASLGELTAGIAHEIQNPLNFVNNFSEVSIELLDEMKIELDRGNTDDAKELANDVIQNLEKINHHGKRADAIVKGMLQHSRTSSGVKEPTSINALAEEYLRLAYHGLRAKDKSFNATMKTDFDETIGNINIIPQDIGRVILNLITNAFYAVNEKKRSGPLTPEGGIYEPAVTVRTSLNPPSGGRGAGILISVRDNGNGIPAKVLDKIFQPFFTTKPTGEGTGLGLSLAYDIVKAHGGELKVETKVGEFTDFVIIL